MKHSAGAALAAALSLGWVSAASAEMFVNGDFESGNIGFGTDFTFSPTGAITFGDYALVTDPSPANPSFNSFGDLTSGSGNMMIADGIGIAWSQTVVVKPFTTYHISFQVAALTDDPTAVAFWDPVPGGDFYGPSFFHEGPGPWGQVVTTWYSGNLDIATFNLAFMPGPNSPRLAFDNISFGVPEPSTWAMMIIGFGAVGSMVRTSRRRQAYAFA